MEKRIILIPLLVISLFLNFNFIPKANADTTVYDVNSPRNDAQRLDGDNDAGCGAIECSAIFIGEEITSLSSLINQNISKIVIELEKTTDGQVLEGSVLGGVWSSTVVPTASNQLRSCGSVSANSITDGLSEFTFTCNSSYKLTEDDAVGVFYGNIDAIDDGLFVSARSTAFDGVNTRATCYSNAQSGGPANNPCFLATGVGQGAQWIDDTSTDIIMEMILTSSAEFCTLPENENLLRCRIEDGALSGNFQNNPFDISQSSSNILIQTGFLDGSDTNPATNGTGYLILAIALIIANVLLWIGTGGSVFTQSTFFLPALVSLVIIMGFTIAGLIDATALIISVVVVIALASPKIVSLVGGLRGGGSSE